MSLVLHNVSHTYPNGVRALDHVTLAVGPGLFGLLGPNGAGKSTLMRCIATLQTPGDGAIRFADIDARADPRALRATLGYLPQDFGVYPKATALDLLDQLAVLKGFANPRARREEVERRLAQVNLWDARARAVAGYSGGMRRRFGLAQALIGEPKLVIVDEPTAGLDPQERDRVHELLADAGDRATVLLSTHIVEDVENLCSRVAVLARGRIVREGTPADLLADLHGRLWATTIDRTAPVPPNAVTARLAAGRRRVHVLADSAPGPDWRPVAPGLEDVYFAALAA